MKQVIFSALTMLVFSLQAHAEIHEIQKMEEINSFVDAETLVVFDIDNTLAEGSETIGTVQWQENEIKRAAEDGLPEDKQLDRSVRRFVAVNFVAQLRPVEASTSLLVQRLQARGAKVMALTARPAELHKRTSYLLNRVGIHLENNPPLKRSLRSYVNEAAIFENGILAVGSSNDKGEMLDWILSQPDIAKYKRIVFVDDKIKYVNSVEKAFSCKDVELHTFRYGAADARVQAFDKDLARFQTDHFLMYGTILPDEEARRIIDSK